MPLRMGRVNQIYYWPVLWCSSVEAGQGDVIGMEERLHNCKRWCSPFLHGLRDTTIRVTAATVCCWSTPRQYFVVWVAVKNLVGRTLNWLRDKRSKTYCIWQVDFNGTCQSIHHCRLPLNDRLEDGVSAVKQQHATNLSSKSEFNPIPEQQH